MALPIVPLPTGKVTIGGEDVEVRGLSRAEVHLMRDKGEDPNKGEAFLIAVGCGITQDEAAEWLTKVPAGTAQTVLQEILELSGLDDLGKESAED